MHCIVGAICIFSVAILVPAIASGKSAEILPSSVPSSVEESVDQPPKHEVKMNSEKSKLDNTKQTASFMPWFNWNGGSGWNNGGSGWNQGPGSGWGGGGGSGWGGHGGWDWVPPPGSPRNPAKCLPPGQICTRQADCCQYNWKHDGWSHNGDEVQANPNTVENDIQCVDNLEYDVGYSTCCVRFGKLGCGSTPQLCCGYDASSSFECYANRCIFDYKKRSSLNGTTLDTNPEP